MCKFAARGGHLNVLTWARRAQDCPWGVDTCSAVAQGGHLDVLRWAPDYPTAAGWFRRAADAGVGDAANNLTNMYTLGRGRAWQTMPASTSETLVS